MSLVFFGLKGQSSAIIKITADPIKREYKVLYSNTEAVPVTITLKGPAGNVIFEDKFGNAQAFAKVYSLVDAPLGIYKWEIKYGSKSYTEEIEIMSEKKLIKESISATLDDLLNLTISVEKYNKLPLSIFIYDGLGKQLEFIFWEPTVDNRNTTINLSQYDAYDFKLEVLQQGDQVLVQEFKTY